MKIGYARVSTVGQKLDRQDDYFKGMELDRLYEEKASGKDRSRPQLEKMLRELSEGDVVYVCELSRLGRSVIDLCNIVNEIMSKGASFVSLKEGIDLSSPYSELIFHIMASLAEFERKQTLERQREGIEAAKARGQKLGAEKKYRPRKAEEIFRAYFNKEISFKEACARYGSKGSFEWNYKKWREAERGTSLREG